jgi:Lectin C-type domain
MRAKYLFIIPSLTFATAFACSPSSDPCATNPTLSQCGTGGTSGKSGGASGDDDGSGGKKGSSGGSRSSSGGRSGNTGGSESSTGGSESTIGGSESSTGGSETSTGGANLGGDPSLGGEGPAVGGYPMGGESGVGGDYGMGGAMSGECSTSVDGAYAAQIPEGKCYVYYPIPSSWEAADETCRDAGGLLAGLSNSEILDFVYDQEIVQDNSWIGASDLAEEGDFVWQNGDEWSDPPWDGYTYYYYNIPYHYGEPNGGTAENCVEYYTDQQLFNDLFCEAERSFICEFEGGPTVEPVVPN